MLCTICKEKPATVHLTQIVVTRCRSWICARIAQRPKASTIRPASPWRTWYLVLGLGASQELEQTAGAVQFKCPRCGFSQADFKKSGRLGCPECYQTFAEGLSGLLKTMHKGVRHIGKAPEALRKSRETGDRLKTLQDKFNKAVKDEITSRRRSCAMKSNN